MSQNATHTFTANSKLSDLLELAINDLQVQEKTGKFTFVSDTWLRSNPDGTCSGCLAGAVLRNRGLATGTEFSWGLNKETLNRDQIVACQRINAARMGGLVNDPDVFENLGSIADIFRARRARVAYACLEPIRKKYSPLLGRAPSKQIRQAIRRLRRNGL